MNTGPSSLSSGHRRLRSGRQLGQRGPFRAADFLLWSWQKGTGSVFSKDTGPTECHSLTALSPPRGPTSQPCHRGGRTAACRPKLCTTEFCINLSPRFLFSRTWYLAPGACARETPTGEVLIMQDLRSLLFRMGPGWVPSRFHGTASAERGLPGDGLSTVAHHWAFSTVPCSTPVTWCLEGLLGLSTSSSFGDGDCPLLTQWPGKHLPPADRTSNGAPSLKPPTAERHAPLGQT